MWRSCAARRLVGFWAGRGRGIFLIPSRIERRDHRDRTQTVLLQRLIREARDNRETRKSCAISSKGRRWDLYFGGPTHHLMMVQSNHQNYWVILPMNTQSVIPFVNFMPISTLLKVVQRLVRGETLNNYEARLRSRPSGTSRLPPIHRGETGGFPIYAVSSVIYLRRRCCRVTGTTGGHCDALGKCDRGSRPGIKAGAAQGWMETESIWRTQNGRCCNGHRSPGSWIRTRRRGTASLGTHQKSNGKW